PCLFLHSFPTRRSSDLIPQWVFVLLGAMRIGVITVPLATTLPESSLRLIAEHAACRVIFADETNWDKAKAVAAELKCDLSKPSLDRKSTRLNSSHSQIS